MSDLKAPLLSMDNSSVSYVQLNDNDDDQRAAVAGTDEIPVPAVPRYPRSAYGVKSRRSSQFEIDLPDDEEDDSDQKVMWQSTHHILQSASFELIQTPIFGITPYPELGGDHKKHADEIHASPGAPPVQQFDDYRNRWRYAGNIVYFIFFGWWTSLVYVIMAGIMALTIVGMPYARLCLNFAWYFWWPFGRYVEGLPHDNISMEYSDGIAEVYTPGRTWSDSAHGIVARGIWYFVFSLLGAPTHLFATGINWFLVGFIPIAKINYSVMTYMYRRPLRVRCRKDGKVQEVLLCTYKAFAKHYFFDTYDGVNIVFVNLLPIVLLTILDGYVLKSINADMLITSPYVIFFLSLMSVVPLVYYVGMGVACVSAQSSFGVAAVVNATFGSIVEIILYIVAILANKGLIVVGSIIGSLVGTLLFLPGLAMIAGGVIEKEQRFNARAAGVSTTLIMISLASSFIPSIFYKIYGSYELVCTEDVPPTESAAVDFKYCNYQLMNPESDPFYHNSVLPLMIFTTVTLPITYLVGLWFSLKTHKDRIYKEVGGRASKHEAVSASSSLLGTGKVAPSINDAINVRQRLLSSASTTAKKPVHRDYTDGPMSDAELENKDSLGEEGIAEHAQEEGHGHGGHGAPPWTRKKALIILIVSTIAFGLLAELLVQSVDYVIQGSGISEKFIGVTLFAIVPSATEYVNAILFAMRKNIELSMEISSQYTVQVTLLQIPVLVIFSLINNNFIQGEITVENSFLLIFESFDMIAITLSFALLSYIYADGRTDYFKGVMMSMVFLILMVAYWFEPVPHY